MWNIVCNKQHHQQGLRFFHFYTTTALCHNEYKIKSASTIRRSSSRITKTKPTTTSATLATVAIYKRLPVCIATHSSYEKVSSLLKRRLSIIEEKRTPTRPQTEKMIVIPSKMFPQTLKTSKVFSFDRIAYHNVTIRKISTEKPSILLKEIDPDVVEYIEECILTSGMMSDDNNNSDIDDIIHGIWKALKPVYGVNMKITHVQSFGVDGIIDLARAVQKEILKSQKSNQIIKSIKVRFHIPHHKTEYIVDWILGQSILDVATNNIDLLGEYMEGTCGGNMSCCTCHIYIYDPIIHEKFLSLVDESEQDMLDLAYNPLDNISRLGCQVVLSIELYQFCLRQDGPITITIPPGVNNVWQVNTWF